jgi:hypothetical protein
MRNDINGINKFIASICGLGRPFYEKKNRRRIEKCLERKGMRLEGKNLEKIIKLRRNLEFLDSLILNTRKIK